MTFDMAGEGRRLSLKYGDEFGAGKKFRGVGFVYNLCVTQAFKTKQMQAVYERGMRTEN